MESPGPTTWPLGALALGAAAVAMVLSLTYLFSPHAYTAAFVALALAVPARSDPGSRRLGTAALVLAALAVGVATAVLFWL